jgi:hypothetical protein
MYFKCTSNTNCIFKCAESAFKNLHRLMPIHYQRALDIKRILISNRYKLIPGFKMIYYDVFTFEGNRAIIFQMADKIPEFELKNCISAGLTYHKIKLLPMLGL